MNLIICTTPFQMLIAENIIKLYHDKDFHLIAITHFDNEKYRLYYDRLKRKCKRSNYIKLLPARKTKLFTLLDLLFIRMYSFFLPTYEKIFLANLESIWVQTFLSRYINKSSFYTYDDGTANIIYNSYLYREEEFSLASRLCFKFIGKKLDLSTFKEKSELHFTIYKDIKNIIPNTRHIELYKKTDKQHNFIYENRREVSIFVGQPLYDFDRDLYKKIPEYISKYGITNYFYHPRENLEEIKKITDIHIIKTGLIFEDYILDILKKQECKIKVYTFFSGSILNISNIPSIEIYAIKPDNFPEEIQSIYNVFSTTGINIIE